MSAYVAPQMRSDLLSHLQRARRRAGRAKAALYRTQVRVRELATTPAARMRVRRERFLRRARAFTRFVSTQDRYGNTVLVRVDDPFIGRDLFVSGAFDEHNIDGALSLLSTTPTTLVDVGANIGPTTIAMLSRFPAMHAVAVEPDAGNLRLLRANLQLNGLDGRVGIVPAAAGASKGTARLTLNPENPGDHHIGRGGVGDVSVELVTLDDLVGRGEIPPGPETLVWVDVQGYEYQVLSGALDLLQSGAPFVIEFWPAALRANGTFDDLLRLIGSCSVFELRRSGPVRVVETRTLADDPALAHGHTDLLLFASATGDSVHLEERERR